MLNETSVRKITRILVGLMIILTGLLVYTAKKDALTAFQASQTQPKYVEMIFKKDEMLEIDIRISDENWNELIENATAEEYVMADIVINDQIFQSVGIRPKGNSSLRMVASDSTTDRYSFKVKFSEFVDDQSLYGLDKLALNNMIGDATYMKEYLSLDMFSAMGIATPGYAFANISINGEPWGLYLALEVMEESFVQRYFGSLNGNLYKPESDSMGNIGGQEKDQNFVPWDRDVLPFNQESIMEIEGEQVQEIASEDGANQMISPQMKSEGAQAEGIIPSEESNQMMPPQMKSEGAQAEGIIPSGETNQMMPPQMKSEGAQVEGIMPSNDGNQMMPPQMGGQGGGMNGPKMGESSSSGTNLVYTDDELSSYAGIFDNTVLKKTTEKEYYKVIEMIKSLEEGTNLESYLDVEEILSYFAVNTFLVNLDSYAGSMKHNYYLYEENGKFQILPWDFNLSFGAFQLSDASKAINFPIDEPVTDTMENSPLISKLLEVDKYKEMYHGYLAELIETYIESGYFEETMTKIHALIGEAVANDTTAFYSYEEYTTALPHLLQFAYDRAKSIKAQLTGEQPSDNYGTVETTVNLTSMGSQNRAGGNKGEGKNNMGNIREPMIGEEGNREINEEGMTPAIPSIENQEPLDGKPASVDKSSSQMDEIISPEPTMNQRTSQGIKEILSMLIAKHPQLATLTGNDVQTLLMQLAGKTEESLSQGDRDLLESYNISGELIELVLNLVNQVNSQGVIGGVRDPFGMTNDSTVDYRSQLEIVAMSLISACLGLWGVVTFKKRKYSS